MKKETENQLATFEEDYHFSNLLPDSVRKAVLSIPQRYYTISENALIIEVYQGEPDIMDQALRMQFWKEYLRVFQKRHDMVMEKVFSGVCNPTTFYKIIIQNPGRLAFITRQPVADRIRTEVYYNSALKKVSDIINHEVLKCEKTGKPDHKLMKLQLEAFMFLHESLHGTATQRIEQKTLQVTTPILIPDKNIEEEIRKLEESLSNNNQLPPAIDVSSVVMDQTKEEVRGRRGN